MRTINRTPFDVDKPDVEYKFFNHYNWKGLNINKNYFDIDQETFEDCKNVYVDENGILKSRPSIKLLTSSGLVNIVDSWIFGSIKIHKTFNSGIYTLYFIEGDNMYSIPTVEDAKVVNIKDKILILTRDTIQLYKDGTVSDASNFIYVPETVIYTNGLKSDEKENTNILTSATITTYLYNNVSFIYNAEIYDKVVTLELDDKVYKNITFTTGMERVLFTESYKLSKSNYSPKHFLGEYTENIPMIQVMEYENSTITLLSSVSITDTSTVKHNIYYSVDGYIFNEIVTPKKFLGMPFLCEEYSYVIIACTDGLYALNLSGSDPYNEYNTWQKFRSITLRETVTLFNPESNNHYNGNLKFGGKFINLDNYVFSYAEPLGGPGFIRFVYTNGESSGSFMLESVVSDTLTDLEVYGNILNRPIALDFKIVNSNVFVAFSLQHYVNTSTLLTNSYLVSDMSGSADYAVNEYLSVSDMIDNDILYNVPIFNNDNIKLLNVLKKDNEEYNVKVLNFQTSGIQFGLYKSNLEFFRDLVTGKPVYTNDNVENILTLSDTNETVGLIGENSLLTNKGLYILDVDITNIPFNTIVYPIANKTYNYIATMYSEDKDLCYYTSDLTNHLVKIKLLHEGQLDNLNFDYLISLNAHYAAIGNTLYISESKYDDNGNDLLYFPSTNKHTFLKNITNLHAISSSQVAIFFEDEIWYTNIEEFTNDVYVYTINKSKLNVGCQLGDEVVTTFDGKYTVFPSQRGLVAMAYQDFVASTEQTLTYLSDAILTRFLEFSAIPVKLTLYKHWLYCYNANGIYLFDFRNNSWWYFEYIKEIHDVLLYNNSPLLIISGREFMFDNNADNYYDEYINNNLTLAEERLSWYFVSQKLHLGTLNYTKNVISLALNALQESDESDTIRLQVTNYRKNVSAGEEQTIEYKVNVLRTFVKRLNYFKVNQFQYTISNDDVDENPHPFAIDSILIKYKITGQVR